MKNKLEVIKQKITSPCYCCTESQCGKARPRKGCLACKGTGIYKENHYIFITTNSKGQQFAIDSDTLS